MLLISLASEDWIELDELSEPCMPPETLASAPMMKPALTLADADASHPVSRDLFIVAALSYADVFDEVLLMPTLKV